MSQLKTYKENKNNIEIIRLEGEVDESNIDELKSEILPFLEGDSESLILNIEKLTYMNSMIIGWFASLIGDFSDKGKKFVFSEPNEEIYDIIDLVGLTAAIETYDTNEEALLSFD